MLAVAICAVVTVAATGDKDGNFDTVYADKVLARMGIFDLLQCDVLRSKVVLAEKIIVSHPDSSNLSSVHITNRENGLKLITRKILVSSAWALTNTATARSALITAKAKGERLSLGHDAKANRPGRRRRWRTRI